MKVREITAATIAPVLRITGYRFDKSFRQTDCGWKAFVFKYLINTTGANIRAGVEIVNLNFD